MLDSLRCLLGRHSWSRWSVLRDEGRGLLVLGGSCRRPGCTKRREKRERWFVPAQGRVPGDG